jgi:valyl-tRNA synthetase
MASPRAASLHQPPESIDRLRFRFWKAIGMTPNELPKQYDPQGAQERWYPFWLEKGYFHADPASPRPAYCIVIPPPNVTGALHLGHALNNTLQDILIRWRRMQGYDCLWMPGTDHAGIATQAVVEKRIFENEKKTRHDLGRDELVRRIWEWKDEYESRILGQLRLMGCSCDWDRTRFTLDDMCSKAVRRTFFNLFKDGKIFRGKRLVNWDTQLRTAVADDEIYYEETQGHLWTIKYPVSGSETGEVLHVATTRPETMLGDTAVAVHPDDVRYKHLIGKSLDLPLTGRTIPIIADPILVDPAFGTGCVKVTPAHDPNDYQTGLRHGLPMINLLNPDGTYNENAGAYVGLPAKKVRERVVADLKEQGFLERVDSYLVRLNHSDRSKTPIEPYLSDQWFVRMGDDADASPGFAQHAMDAVSRGMIRITPERYAKSYLDWLGEKRDWCISRQLWWGHRIPVWSKAVSLTQEQRQILDRSSDSAGLDAAYSGSDPQIERVHEELLDALSEGARAAFRGHPAVEMTLSWEKSENSAEALILACVDHGQEELERKLETKFGFVRDPDVLDTWFSSALWPHSTLGWPEETLDLEKFYPTSVLSTARDIITLWVARMVIFGLFNRRQIPFRDVYIHPVIMDGKGERMSKSKGNGVDPVDIIELFGADALRYSLAFSATETQDLRIPVEKVKLADGRTINSSEKFEQGRNFANKLWNSARFALMNLEGYESGPIDLSTLPAEDRWILAGLDRLIEETSKSLGQFQFADATRRLRDFTWGDFCDWYVEFVKGRLRDPASRPAAQRVLAGALDVLCRLLHPVMPFVTEEIWQALGAVAPSRGFAKPEPAAESVCIAPWPTPIGLDAGEDSSAVESWRAAIAAIRNLKAERNVPKEARIAPILVAVEPARSRLKAGEPFLLALTNAATVSIVTPEELAERPADAAVAVLPDVEVILPLEGLIDKEAERARLRKALADVNRQLDAVRAKLRNESFVSRAPAEVVEQQRAKEADLASQYAAIEALLATSG